jgi:hypothetical protein
LLIWRKREWHISTCHNDEMSTISKDGKEVKPKVAFDYSTNMGGVSLKDQMLQKGTDWYITFFRR